MTLPIPPSDSLYKFTAIGGLILVVLSMYVPWKLGADLRMVEIDMELERAKAERQKEIFERAKEALDGKSQDLGTAITELRKRVEQTRKKSKQDSPEVQAEHAWLVDELDKLKIETERFNNMGEEGLLADLKLINAANKNIAAKEQLINLVLISRKTFWIGVIMTVFGFLNWYFRFQVHQDRIIKAQAEQWTKPRTTEREKEEIPG